MNYRERFVVDDVLFLPAEIWVGDIDAFRIAQETFTDVEIKLKSNSYFEDNKYLFDKLYNEKKSKTSDENILYVCSPVREHTKLQYVDELY